MKKIVIVLVLALGLSVQSVAAQELVFSQNQAEIEAEIERLTTQYRSELNDYRRDYDQYKIHQQQYLQLDTLASLETAVQSTQRAMQTRDHVLKSYLSLLRLRILLQTGISVEDKTAAENDLLAAVNQIDQHRQSLEGALDKLQIEEQAVVFETISPQIENAAYRAQSLLMIGRLQASYDKAVVLRQDIAAEFDQEEDGLVANQRQRSLDEIERSLVEIQSEFDQVEQRVIFEEKVRYEQVFRRVREDLAPVYTALSRVGSFLGEVLSL